MTACLASSPSFLLIDPVRVYGDLDAGERTVVVRDVGVLPPAGVYGCRVAVVAAATGAEHAVEARVVVPPRRDGRYVGIRRVLEILDPVPTEVGGGIRSTAVTFMSVLVATGLPAVAA